MATTPAQLAGRISRDLAALVEDAGWTTTSDDDDQPQGHYTDPIADALEDLGIVDLSTADSLTVRKARRRATGYCLDKLSAHYAAEININSDGTSLSLESVFSHIQQLRETLVGSAGQGMQLRSRRRLDYSLGSGLVTDTDDLIIVDEIWPVN